MRFINHLILIVLLLCSTRTVLGQQQKISRKDLIRKLQRIEVSCGKRPENYFASGEWDTLQIKILKLRFLLRFYQLSPAVLNLINQEFKLSEKLIRSLKNNDFKIATGLREEGYFCRNDNSFQPYVRFLPKNWDKKKKLPLIIYLHGYFPDMNIINWAMLPDALQDLAEQAEMCIAMPFARSNSDFQGIGEQDVLNVLEHVSRRYAIDRDRVILTGLSMGGMGAWTIGSHYPHLFAGMMIVSGRGDFYFWHKLQREKLPPYKRLMIDTEFGSSHLSNLVRMPILCFHGVQDPLINISEARNMHKLLGLLNPRFKFIELPKCDHWISEEVFARKDVLKWFSERKREQPETFKYVTYHPRYNRGFWTLLNRFGNLSDTPYSVKPLKSEEKITIKTNRISSVTVDPGLMPVKLKKSSVIAGDKDLTVNKGNIASAPSPIFHWGPMKDAFLTPFIFVDCAKPLKGRIISDTIKNRALEWYKFTKSFPRITTEKQLTERQKKNYNVFLFGEVENSSLIRQALEKTPVKITKDHYILGKLKFPRKGNGLIIKYVSPWSAVRSVVIQCGVPWGEQAPENHRYDLIPGYIIYSRETDPNDPFNSNKPLAAGFFDNSGKLFKELMYVDPAYRKSGREENRRKDTKTVF